MSSTAEHRAPIASLHAMYGPVVHPHTFGVGPTTQAAIVAIQQNDGAGLGSTGPHGQHVAYISDEQFARELSALGYLFPFSTREALEWAWLTQNSPLDYTPAQ